MAEDAGDLKLREPVAWFAQRMEAKLRKRDYKSGWEGLKLTELLQMLRTEVDELDDAIANFDDDPDDILLDELLDECADVLNFTMMIADNARRMKDGRTD